MTLRCKATLFVARLPAGATATFPASALLHVFVARGTVTLTVDEHEVQLLSEDAVRMTDASRCAGRRHGGRRGAGVGDSSRPDVVGSTALIESVAGARQLGEIRG